MTPDPGTTKAQDNFVLPFTVERTGVRGRLVRLGETIDTILSRHDYPGPVSVTLGEALVAASLLGNALKSDGWLSLQVHSDGPVSMLVASYRAPGTVRGYAMLDRERWEAMEREAGHELTPRDVLGSGQFALTIDPGGGLHRYQGIVELKNGDLLEGLHEYFQQSEQLATRLVLSVGRNYLPADKGSQGHWRAGGIFIQHMAADGGRLDDDERRARQEAEGITMTEGGEPVEEAWNRVVMLLKTTENHELIDPVLKPEELLYRLFHEDGVRVYDKAALGIDCRCTRERLENILRQYTDGDLSDLIEDGSIRMRCEFCSRDFYFDPETVTGDARNG